jgi:gentisate 1,2-dioxygenase
MRQQLYRDMDPHNLTPLWEVLHALVPPKPNTPCAPALWKYADVRPFLLRAGEAITAEEAVRRVLILENPKLRGQSAVTQSLYAGLQLILPAKSPQPPPHAKRAALHRRRQRRLDRGRRRAHDDAAGRLHHHPSWTWHDHGSEADGRWSGSTAWTSR